MSLETSIHVFYRAEAAATARRIVNCWTAWLVLYQATMRGVDAYARALRGLAALGYWRAVANPRHLARLVVRAGYAG